MKKFSSKIVLLFFCFTLLSAFKIHAQDATQKQETHEKKGVDYLDDSDKPIILH